MEPLKEAIEEFLKAHKLDKRLDQYEVFRIWDELVGERIAKVARPDFI